MRSITIPGQDILVVSCGNCPNRGYFGFSTSHRRCRLDRDLRDLPDNCIPDECPLLETNMNHEDDEQVTSTPAPGIPGPAAVTRQTL